MEIATASHSSQEEVQRPSWFYQARHGLERLHNTNTCIEFHSDGGTSLKFSLVEDPGKPEQWNVEWKITHLSGMETTGKAIYPRTVLLEAFGITRSRRIPPCAMSILHRFKGDMAVQGRFIRKGPYLNIPGPGTGLPEDPNLSIFLTEDLVECVKLFLGCCD